MEIIKIEKFNKLFSYYQTLLTDKQVEYFTMYYYEDYSLSEIAELANVSRNAVYDQLKRVEAKLLELEEKLKLVEKASLRSKYIKEYLLTKDQKYLNMILEVDEKDE